MNLIRRESKNLFRQIMSISRKYQYKVLGSETNELLPFKQVDKLDVDKDTRIVCFGETWSIY